MSVFAVVIFIAVTADFIFRSISPRDHKALYCLTMFIVCTLVLGLRSPYVGGVDTSLVYIPAFEQALNTPLGAFMTDHDYRDPLFYIFTKLCTYVTGDYQVFLFIIAAICMGSFCVFVYRYSDHPVMSFALFFALGYYAIEFEMLRHSLAASVLLFAYPYIERRKPVQFLLLVALATGFHMSAVVFVIAYLASYAKVGLKQGVILVFFIGFCYAFRGQVATFLMGLLAASDRFSSNIGDYSTAGTFGLGGFFVVLAIWLFSYLILDRQERETRATATFLNLGLYCTCIMSITPILGELHRVAMFFGFSLVLLLPRAFKHSIIRNGQSRKVAYGMVLTVLLAYFFFIGVGGYELADYQFFWDVEGGLFR